MCSCKKTKFYKNVTHCIFDMDGTLLDTECVYADVITGILKDYNKEYTVDGRRQILGSTTTDTCKILVEYYNLPESWENIFTEFKKRCLEVLSNCPLMPGVDKLVPHLYKNGIPIAIATSSMQDVMELKIKHLQDFFSMFHHIVAGGTDPEVKRGKPKPDIFLVCASRFEDKPDPSKCIVFEDAPNGARAAIDAGMQCIIMPDPIIPKKLCRHATAILNSMEDFVPEQFGLPPY